MLGCMEGGASHEHDLAGPRKSSHLHEKPSPPKSVAVARDNRGVREFLDHDGFQSVIRIAGLGAPKGLAFFQVRQARRPTSPALIKDQDGPYGAGSRFDELWGPAENWQVQVERLQEWVCLLLTKNQILREALQAERMTRQRVDSSQNSLPNIRRPQTPLRPSAYLGHRSTFDPTDPLAWRISLFARLDQPRVIPEF
jgi:hypothetical protein